MTCVIALPLHTAAQVCNNGSRTKAPKQASARIALGSPPKVSYAVPRGGPGPKACE